MNMHHTCTYSLFLVSLLLKNISREYGTKRGGREDFFVVVGEGGGGSEERKGCWREYGSKEQKARDERETNGEYKGNEIGIEDREEYKGKRWQRGGD